MPMQSDDLFITPADARERLRLAERSSPIVRAVNMVAQRDGLNDEDRFALMAYHLMRSADEFQRVALDYAKQIAPRVFIGVPQRVAGADLQRNEGGA